MQSKATTVAEYLASLPPERREALEALRKVFHANMDPLFEEGMQYGMIGYYLPHSVYPAGYHCDPRQPLPFAGLASQKNHLSLYLMCLYAGSDLLESFAQAWRSKGFRLDMGRCCVRFRSLEAVPLEVVGALLKKVTAREYIAHYEASIRTHKAARSNPDGKPARAGKVAKSAGNARTTTSGQGSGSARKPAASKKA